MGHYFISQQDKTSNSKLVPGSRPIWCVPLPQVLIVMALFFYWQRGRRSGICIQHHYLVPPPVHPLTYQVRPFTVPLLHMGTSDEKKEKKEKNKGEREKVTFLCMQKCELHWSFFYWWKKKKETGAVGMKVNNMHEFVKKINNAAFVG